MPGPDSISVVIPTKNGAETLPQLLEGLFAQRVAADLEVVAVDSGSSDHTLAILETHPVQVHRIPASDFDHGGTRNYAIARTRGEYVALLTQDAIPASTELLESLVRPFEDPTVAGVYGRQIPRSDCDVVRRRELEDWVTGRTERAVSRLGDRALSALPPAERYRLCAFDNVCSALRRSVWEKHPFPTTDFGEDMAWGKAVLEGGWAIAYEPDAVVVHSHRRSIRDEYERTRICQRRLRELFGVAPVPSLRFVLLGIAWSLRREIPYVLRNAPPGMERWRQLLRIAALSTTIPIAQYRGLQDAGREVGEGERP